jgi:hypothetical protein
VSYLGVPVGPQDIDRYSGIEFYDLCQLVVMQSEEIASLIDEIDREQQELKAQNGQLDPDDPFDRFQIDTAIAEHQYVRALRFLRLARKHESEMQSIRFYKTQTKVLVRRRVVYYLNQEADMRCRAKRAGIVVEKLRRQYLS